MTQPAAAPAQLATVPPLLVQLVERAANVDIRSYEVDSDHRIVTELRPFTRALLADSCTVLNLIITCCPRGSYHDQPAATSDHGDMHLPETSFGSSDSGAAAADAMQAVTEIATLALMELRQRDARLARSTDGARAMALLVECDSALRRIRKAAAAVEAAVAIALGESARLVSSSELEVSLAVRRTYASVRRRILDAGPPDPEDMHRRFRLIGTELAVLIGRDIYTDLRIHDRLLLRNIQERVLGWLRGGEAALTNDGMRIWQDLAGLLEMLRLVNQRQDLVAHDAARIAELTEFLADRAVAADASPDAAEALRSLEGLDDELDCLVADPAGWPTSRVLEILQRITAERGLGRMA